MTSHWQTSISLDTSTTVFEGLLSDQADGPPVANHYPTTAWRPGEIVQDSRPLPTGDRHLIGLYDPVMGERLPAFTAEGARLADAAVVLAASRC